MRDQDGFVILKRKASEMLKPSKEKRAKKKKEKEKRTIDTKQKNPFKKGSWKHFFWKNAKKFSSNRCVKFFHNINFQNFIVWRDKEDSSWEIAVQNGHLGNGFISELKNADKANILISVGDQMYAKISPEAYKKLSKVDKIIIQYELKSWADGKEDEPVTILEDYNTIDNINELMSFVNYYRQCIYGVFDVQAKCCWYDIYLYEFKILVTFRNGDCKTYKGDMNDFMKDFDLYRF